MKRINFKKLKTEVSIGVFQEIDMTKEIGNLLFKNANSIEMDALARRIYSSEGEIEIDGDEFEQMKRALSPILLQFAKDAIESNTKEVIEKEVRNEN